MCGIFCILNNKHGIELVKSCFNKGSKRGPENSTLKFINDMDLILGFHRLAINGYKNINSEQPIYINNCTLICNGEIYNWKQLHKTLHIPNTTGSDCEIIIHLYQKYGIEYTLNILDGVYSFILFDNKNGSIFVSRDQFGIRPLFQTVIHHPGLVKTFSYVFASEMKQLIKGEPIIRSEPEKTEKKVRRRRRKTKNKSNIETKVPQNIITKPAT